MHIPLQNRPLIFLDTETTGLNPERHEIIDIALVFDRSVAERIGIIHLLQVDGEEAYFKSKVKPLHIHLAEPEALRVNKYTEEGWKNAPTFEAIAPVLLTLLKEGLYAGHNVTFDLDFLKQAFKRIGLEPYLGYHKIDTVAFAYAFLVPKGLKKLSLDEIRKFIPLESQGTTHEALTDARDAKRLYQHCMSRCTEAGS